MATTLQVTPLRVARIPRSTPTTLRAVLAALVVLAAVFTSNAMAGRDAFTGLEIGIVVLALIMAGGCAWGLYQRLVEYR
jgi:UDP-N-acetylmuramyl pentapeptide phosphotransferase/UDP-N-acetylglucosamine-1-phosphate transferase